MASASLQPPVATESVPRCSRPILSLLKGNLLCLAFPSLFPHTDGCLRSLAGCAGTHTCLQPPYWLHENTTPLASTILATGRHEHGWRSGGVEGCCCGILCHELGRRSGTKTGGGVGGGGTSLLDPTGALDLGVDEAQAFVARHRAPPPARKTEQSGKEFRVGIFLDFASSSARAHHGACVRGAERSRIDPHWVGIERLWTRTLRCSTLCWTPCTSCCSPHPPRQTAPEAAR